MSWPTPLPAPTPIRARGALANALAEPTLAASAAARWARLLERDVRIAVAPGPPQPSPLRAWAAFTTDAGERGGLAVDRHLLAGVLLRLAGGAGRPVGPCPLSPAEEGLFAYLALEWLQLAPSGLTLQWVHGGDPAWPLRGTRRAGLPWQVEIDGLRGMAVWWLPTPAPPEPSTGADRVPHPLRVRCSIRLDVAPLQPGDRLPCPPPLVMHGHTPLFGVRPSPDGLRLTPPEIAMAPPALETLSVPVTLDMGQVVLPAGQIAALREGDLLPVTVESPPLITLKVGDQIVAMGVLVEDEGGLGVQITRVVGAR